MVGWVWLVVCALAVARITGLLVQDELTRPVREWVGARLHIDHGRHPHLAYLLECPWCVSVYVGAVVAALVYWLGCSPWLLIPALALAFSQITGMISGLGRS